MAPTRIDWLAWWQLLRAANVFTAASNVIAGFLLVQRDWQPLGPLVLLLFASICLYEAGMVLNDVFDSELDSIERPERPIPSGRIHRRTAYLVGLVLLGGGNLAALFASLITRQFNAIGISASLTFAILTYNGWAKAYSWGPWVMGSCRSLNVLLGASVARKLLGHPAPLCWAIGIGLFTVGLTLIARHENVVSRSGELLGGAALVLGGMLAAISLPFVLQEPQISSGLWFSIAFALLATSGYFIVSLLFSPHHIKVRHSVGALITLFIPLDAAACSLAAGGLAGCLVLLLIVPVRILSRWTGQT